MSTFTRDGPRNELLTSVLYTALSQDTMAPVRHTPHDLHTASSVGRTRVGNGIFLLLRIRRCIDTVEPLLKVSSNLLPMFPVGVSYDRFIWCGVNIMRKGEPVVMSIKTSQIMPCARRQVVSLIISILASLNLIPSLDKVLNDVKNSRSAQGHVHLHQ